VAAMTDRPRLSVVVPLREGLDEIEPVLAGLLPQAAATGTEVLLVGRLGGPAPAGARSLEIDDDDLYRLRLAGIEAAQGDVVAIGEDHAVPRPDWCEATIRAHRERPEVPCVLGCLVNATDQTLGGRSNFLAFAAPFQPPLSELPNRPSPVSAISIKSVALSESFGRPGHFETILFPRLWRERLVAVDDRIAVDHYQDRGIAWSIANAFRSARASYGYASDGLRSSQRTRQARWSLLNWPRLLVDEARSSSPRLLDLALVRVLALAAGVGGAVGSLTGPGRSPLKVA
jgi:hypothetical protein